MRVANYKKEITFYSIVPNIIDFFRNIVKKSSVESMANIYHSRKEIQT